MSNVLPLKDELLAEFDSGKVPRSETWHTLITGLYYNFDQVNKIETWYQNIQDLTILNQKIQEEIEKDFAAIEVIYGQVQDQADIAAQFAKDAVDTEQRVLAIEERLKNNFEMVESKPLACGATVVDFDKAFVSGCALYLTGQLTDNGRLIQGLDYLVNGVQRITLNRTYPEQVVITAAQYTNPDSSVIVTSQGKQVTYDAIEEASLVDNYLSEQIVIINRDNAVYGKISDELAEDYQPGCKFQDATGQWWGVQCGQVLHFSTLLTDPLDRNQVDNAVRQMNCFIRPGLTVMFAKTYVWPTVSFTTNGVDNIRFNGGVFVRKDNIGTEYLVWITESDGCTVSNMHFDGGVSTIPQWGQQCVYVRKSTNTLITQCYFENIGDAPIRYALATTVTSDIVLTTRGLVIAENTFKKCTQLTSNGTGGSEVIIVNNVFINAAIKITQRTALLNEGSTLIAGNTFLMDTNLGYKYDQNCISAQGCKNLHIKNNSFVQKTNSTVFECYANSGSSGYPFGPIPCVNIYFCNNDIRMFGNSRLFSCLGHWDSTNNDHISPFDSELVISNNKISIENDIPDDGIIRSDSYGGGGNAGQVAGFYLVEGNIITGNGKALCLFQTSGQSGLYIGDGGKLLINNNQGKFSSSLCSGAFKLHPGGHFQIAGNTIYAPGMTGNFQSVMNSKNCIFEVINNRHYMTDIPEGDTTLVASINNNNFYGDTQIYSGNTIIRLSETGNTGRYAFWLWPIHGSMTIPTSLVFTDNRILLSGEYIGDDGYKTRPLYVNTLAGGQSSDKLLAANNWYRADNGAHSDSSDVLSVDDLLLLNSATTPLLYKVRSGHSRPSFDASGKSWVKYEQYSDGRYREWGYQYKEYAAPQSGNTYLATKTPHTDYSILITPEHTDPVAFTVKGKYTGHFQTQMSLANSTAEVRPYFHYQIEWNVNDSFG